MTSSSHRILLPLDLAWYCFWIITFGHCSLYILFINFAVYILFNYFNQPNFWITTWYRLQITLISILLINEMSRRKILQDFTEIVDIGSKVVDEAGELQTDWKTKSGHVYYHGYSVNRRINCDGERIVDVTNSIVNCNLHNIPLFESKVFESGVLIHSILTKNPTTTFRGVLDALCIKVPVKSVKGFRFFAFDSIEYQNKKMDIGSISLTSLMNTESNDKDISSVTSTVHSRQCSWTGIVSYGTALPGNPLFYTKLISGIVYRLQPGYEAIRTLYLGDGEQLQVKLRIIDNNSVPNFTADINTSPVTKLSSANVNDLVTLVFKSIDVVVKKKWSGYEFFGFMKPDVLSELTKDTSETKKKQQQKAKPVELAQVLKSIENIAHRNAGPTGDLSARGMAGRNKKIHELVEYISSGDVVKYIEYLIQNHADEINAAVDGNASYLKKFVKTFKPRFTKELSVNEAASILAGKLELSQRKYIALREILSEHGICLPGYKEVSEYVKTIDVGDINTLTDSGDGYMGYGTNIVQTLQKIIDSKGLYDKFQFLSFDHQQTLQGFLLEKNHELYRSYNPNEKTIFLRDTADNFRACAKMPTEQTSFSILNIPQLLNSPNGQFISTLWRGEESRKNFDINVMATYQALHSIVTNGVTLLLDGEYTYFNVIVFLVADLSCVKELLGRCSVNHSLGCFYCNLPSEQWDVLPQKFGTLHSLGDLEKMGAAAEEALGKYPDKYSSKYKTITKKKWTECIRFVQRHNFGFCTTMWASPYFGTS